MLCASCVPGPGVEVLQGASSLPFSKGWAVAWGRGVSCFTEPVGQRPGLLAGSRPQSAAPLRAALAGALPAAGTKQSLPLDVTCKVLALR